MSILLDETYHGLKHLQDNGVDVVFQSGDQPVVNLGVLNLMPQAECYELELLQAFADVALCVRPVWLRVEHHGYRSSNPEVLKNYRPYHQSPHPLHGLIVTGAPVEHLPFEAVNYWEELQGILHHARRSLRCSLGVCWGGLAMGRMLGLEKVVYPKKQFGVYSVDNLDQNHDLAGAFGSRFHCPVSTHSGIEDEAWQRAAADGRVRLLAHAPDAGYLMAESEDGRFLMHFGHPEYGPERLPEEYKRDVARGKTDVDPPENVDLSRPVNSWKTEGDRFFERFAQRCLGDG